MRQSIDIKKWAVFTGGLFLFALGCCGMTKADLGLAPVPSVSWVVSYITNFSYGTVHLGLNCFFILVQAVFLGWKFDKTMLLQILLSLLLSIFLDLVMPFMGLLDVFTADFAGRVLVFALSIVVMGIGIGLQALPQVTLLPVDNLARIVASRMHRTLGTAKILIDCSSVVLSTIISLLFLGRLEGIQIGTAISALLTGNVVRIFMKSTAPLSRRLRACDEFSVARADDGSSPPGGKETFGESETVEAVFVTKGAAVAGGLELYKGPKNDKEPGAVDGPDKDVFRQERNPIERLKGFRNLDDSDKTRG